MSQNNINTTAIQQYISQVRAAELSNQREIKLNIATAKALSHTLSLVMTRLAGDYEGLLNSIQKAETNISVSMDGGSWEK